MTLHPDELPASPPDEEEPRPLADFERGFAFGAGIPPAPEATAPTPATTDPDDDPVLRGFTQAVRTLDR